MARRNYHGVQINPSPTIVEMAGADIADCRNRIMKYDENGNVVLATAGADFPLGIALIEAGYNDITGVEAGKVVAGDDVDIQIKEMGVVIAGAEIKKGQEIAAGADGFAAVAASGDFVLGIALTDAAAGEYLHVHITKYQKSGSSFTASGETMEEEEGEF